MLRCSAAWCAPRAPASVAAVQLAPSARRTGNALRRNIPARLDACAGQRPETASSLQTKATGLEEGDTQRSCGHCTCIPSSRALCNKHLAGIPGLALAASHPALQTFCQHLSAEMLP